MNVKKGTIRWNHQTLIGECYSVEFSNANRWNGHVLIGGTAEY